LRIFCYLLTSKLLDVTGRRFPV